MSPAPAVEQRPSLQVNAGLSWHPAVVEHRPAAAGRLVFHAQGVLSDGRPVTVSSFSAAHLSTHRSAAETLWRHGRVLSTADTCGDLVLIVPVDTVTDSVAVEALRTWAYGLSTPA